MKTLYDISWKVDEPTYRADPALSYSMLAKYERTGFNGLSTLNESISTPSLTFGSVVDSIITGGEEEFNSRFFVADIDDTPDSIRKIIDNILIDYKDICNDLDSIPQDRLLNYLDNAKYQLNWRPETRIKVLKEKGNNYYKLNYVSEGKTLIDTQTYSDAISAVKALKESDATKWYFQADTPFDNTKRYYQLKFKHTLDGINYRCMADLIIVDYDTKVIIPCDLKTSSHYEWDFYKSFIDWKYDIQSRLYYRLIQESLSKDDYFKDFKLLDYRFIVVNRKTLTPLVWECNFTQSKGEIHLGNKDQIILRSPLVIGAELNTYLKYKPIVPLGISTNKPNNLREYINMM